MEGALGRELEFNSPLRYCGGGSFGDVAEETDEESYDLVERLGDRGFGLCDWVAMAEEGLRRVNRSWVAL